MRSEFWYDPPSGHVEREQRCPVCGGASRKDDRVPLIIFPCGLVVAVRGPRRASVRPASAAAVGHRQHAP